MDLIFFFVQNFTLHAESYVDAHSNDTIFFSLPRSIIACMYERTSRLVREFAHYALNDARWTVKVRVGWGKLKSVHRAKRDRLSTENVINNNINTRSLI